MAFSIKSDEADRLARALVDLTGESLTAAVTVSLRERLERERRIRHGDRLARIERRIADFRGLPVLDDRPTHELIRYDAHGLPV
jgi:antitoxin VapB